MALLPNRRLGPYEILSAKYTPCAGANPVFLVGKPWPGVW